MLPPGRAKSRQLNAGGGASARPQGGIHGANVHHRCRFRHSAVFIDGIYTRAEPRHSINPGFLRLLGAPLLAQLFELPLAGPGPVVNKLRRKQLLDADGRPLPAANAPLAGNPLRLLGDYTNPILKPEAAEIVKKQGELELSGGAPTPTNQCWPYPVPYILRTIGMQMFQQPDRITILYRSDQVRRVRMNQPHPAKVTPSWYGDSVGRYEGDTKAIRW
jgi:hypothetical protein